MRAGESRRWPNQRHAAARAIHTVLRSATGEQRRAVIEAPRGERDARVVRCACGLLDESEPLGRITVVLDTLAALKIRPYDTAVRPIAGSRCGGDGSFSPGTRALRNTAVDALASTREHRIAQGADTGGTEGDRLLRRLAQAKLAQARAKSQ